MARVVITNTLIPLNGNIVIPALTAITSTTDGAEVVFNKDDQKMLLMIKNNKDAAKTATIKKGNGLQGVKDLTFSIPAGETHAVVVESGAYKNVTGTDKGKVIIVGETTDIQVACVVLP